jgi:hypothetical protein
MQDASFFLFLLLDLLSRAPFRAILPCKPSLGTPPVGFGLRNGIAVLHCLDVVREAAGF